MTHKCKLGQTYIQLRGVYLPASFVEEHKITTKTQYPLEVVGLPDTDLTGTVSDAYVIGGLAKMYKAFTLQPGHEVELSFEVEGGRIRIDPKTTQQPSSPDQDQPKTIFDQQGLRHIHIEPYRYVSFASWAPKTETDIYMVFGTLSEYELTDFQYCCGASQALLDSLGFKKKSKSKPDAILIDRTTKDYLIAEFKVYSSDFDINHSKEDTDVLICWRNDATKRENLPSRILPLEKLIETALEKGEIEIK